mmetsp:Transcript_6461/g.25040  ORF Transcript_6461/g.25040 Transcript_6461/m.25040 type:complete len:296 (-) Transcript_6461:10-897(-)
MRSLRKRRVQPSLKLENLNLTLERLHLRLARGGSARSARELGVRPRRLGVAKREVQQRRALVEGHDAVRGGDAFGEGEKHLRRESVPLASGVQPREELQVPRLVPRDGAPLPRRLKGTALGEVLLEGTRGELQEVLVAAQVNELGVHAADKGAVVYRRRPGNLRGGGGGDGDDGRGRRHGRMRTSGMRGRRGCRGCGFGGGGGGGRRRGGGRLRAPLEQGGESARAFIRREGGAHRAEGSGGRAGIRDARRQRANRHADVLEALFGIRHRRPDEKAPVVEAVETCRIRRAKRTTR